MAKSKGRTQRPARTSRNTAQPAADATTEVVNDDALDQDAAAADHDAADRTAGASELTAGAESDVKADEKTDSDEKPGTAEKSVTTDDVEDGTLAEADEAEADGAEADEAQETGAEADGAEETAGKKPAAKKKDAKKTAGAKRTSRSGNPAKRAQGRKTATYTSPTGQQTIKPNPRWFLPVLVGLLLLGLIWLVTFYITQGAFPVEAWGNWNILIGFTFFVAGLIMSTRWR